MHSTQDARLKELVAGNARLRRLLDQKQVFSELRHQLRNTLSMLRVIIRQSAETSEDLQVYVARLEDRLDVILATQNAANSAGETSLHNIIADELLRHRAREGETAFLTGPAVFFQPKTAQVLALAFHELVANAIEHGALAPRVDGQIAVSWQVESGPLVALDWKETGSVKIVESTHQGFGMLVLRQMLVYELKADAKLAFEPDGLRYTIRLPLSGRGGRVQATPDLDE